MTDEKPFHLQGNFAPVKEEVTASNLEVIGALPPELNGLYVRNGANPVTGESEHWFLGNGMLHGIRLEGGRASWYRNRYVRTPYFENPEIQRIGADGSVDRVPSAANTHIVRHAGKLMALEEGAFPWIVTEELETVGPHDYDGKLTTAMTAHPKLCPTTGELHFFGYGQLPPYLVYHRVSPEGVLIRSEEIEVGGPTMIHDFAITEGHAIFMDLPVIFDLQMALQGTMPFHWSDDYPARVGILARGGKSADVQWFEVEPCYVFHGMNAYTENGNVVFDVCRISELWRDPGEFTGGDVSLHRWTFDLAGGSVKEETLSDRAVEFPRVADARVGRRHRHGFAVALGSAPTAGPEPPGPAGLVKFDLEKGSSELHEFGPGRSAGEPALATAPGSDPSSDEGWVLTYVYDEGTDRSELQVLDATAFAADPVARIPLPQRVPFGFHGSWLPDEG
jgi:carotenoid cleavage dioxygenase-like enzyme